MGSATWADGLVGRLRPIWPGPDTTIIVRRLRARGPSSVQFAVLPAMGSPRYLVPVGVRLGKALDRADEGQRFPRLQRLVALILYRTPVGARLAPKVVVQLPGADPLLGALREIAPETSHYILRLGRVRAGRAIVVQCLTGDGSTVAFGKLGGGAVRSQVESEAQALQLVNRSRIPGLVAPRPRGTYRNDDWTLSVASSLLPSVGTEASQGPPVDVMVAFAKHWGTTRQRLSEMVVWQEMRRKAQDLPDHESSWLLPMFDDVTDRHGSQVLELGAWHGDWVRWNMVRAGGDVFLWDWEHFERGVPLGVDHLHFLAQEHRSTQGTTPAVEDRWLAGSREALVDDWLLEAASADVTIVFYLLAANLRYILDRAAVEDPPARQGWGRPLLERLLGGES